MMTRRQVICCIVVATLLIHKSQAIKCYYCNSANNSACHDIKLYSKFNIIPVVECESVIPGNIGNKFFCRKIIQTILNPGHDSDVRVTRGCGWVKHHRECYKADNDGHLETVCQCFNDQCNAASGLGRATALLISTSTVVFVLRSIV